MSFLLDTKVVTELRKSERLVEDDAYDLVIAASTSSIDHTEIVAHLAQWTRSAGF